MSKENKPDPKIMAENFRRSAIGLRAVANQYQKIDKRIYNQLHRAAQALEMTVGYLTEQP